MFLIYLLVKVLDVSISQERESHAYSVHLNHLDAKGRVLLLLVVQHIIAAMNTQDYLILKEKREGEKVRNTKD